MKYVIIVILLFAPVFSVCADTCAANNNPAQVQAVIRMKMPIHLQDYSVGQVVAQKTGTLASFSGTNSLSLCDVIDRRIAVQGMIDTQSAGNHVFATNINGIGIRVSILLHYGKHHNGHWEIPFNATVTTTDKGALISAHDIILKAELVKVAKNTGSGILLFNQNNILKISSPQNGNHVNISLTVHSPPVTGACETKLDTSAIDLGDIPVLLLRRAGKSRDKKVSLLLRCDNAHLTQITITGNEVVADDGRRLFRNLEQTRPATGVGAEIVFNKHPVVPGGTVNIMAAGSATALPFWIALRSLHPGKSDKLLRAGHFSTTVNFKAEYL